VLLAACALGALLGADALRGALEAARLGGGVEALALARGVLLIAVALASAITQRAGLALAQAGLALWVYTDIAPVLGDLAAHGFAGARMWLRPLPIAALTFFPCAFFGWRALARGRATRDVS
jgi:hypothetical protein